MVIYNRGCRRLYGQKFDWIRLIKSDQGFSENTLEFGEEVREEQDCGVALLQSSNEQIKKMPIDRLSGLPDSVLVHILSFLFTKEAARTSVLSKRWKFLWAELPRMELWEDGWTLNYDIDKTRYFVSLVNRILGIRKWNYLEELRVRFMYDECFASDVDAWIAFSVKNGVKKFSLRMMSQWNDENENYYYTLPQMMYSASSLTTLCLNQCIMNSQRAIEWQSLTSLSLEEVELDQPLIDQIISSCPVLHDLDLERCWGYNRLEVNSQCLSSLTIEEDSEYEPYVEISAPYISHLSIAVFPQPQGRKWQLENIASVVTAFINFLEFDDECTVEVMSNVTEFLENFKHVKDLHVLRYCFEVLSIMAVNGWQLPQSRVQHLTLASSSGYEHSISGIVGLLESSPNLETLDLNGFDTMGEIVNLDPVAKGDLDNDLLHLKTIKVSNFADSNGEPLLTVARILLRRAPVLEEMMIVVDVEDTSDYVNIAQTLLTYPRSSTKAEIHMFSSK